MQVHGLKGTKWSTRRRPKNPRDYETNLSMTRVVKMKSQSKQNILCNNVINIVILSLVLLAWMLCILLFLEWAGCFLSPTFLRLLQCLYGNYPCEF